MIAVSIIIPTFNREQFLAAAIDSALAQGDGVEVIVVDDGSTDGSATLLGSYGERVRVLQQTNQGPSAARNLGAGHARGDYLFFLDSDDLLEAGAVQSLLAEVKALQPKQVPFGRVTIVDEAGLPASGLTYGYPRSTPGQVLSLADLLSGTMPLWLLLLRRDTYLAAGGLNPNLRRGEDQELIIRLHRAGLRFVATDVKVVCLRVHGDARLSNTHNREFATQLLTFWQRATDLLIDAPDFDVPSRQALARMIWIAGRDAARAKDRPAANSLFALALSLDPTVMRISPRPLRLASRLAGPYRSERLAELVKAALRPPSSFVSASDT